MFKKILNIPDGVYGGCFSLFIGDHSILEKYLSKYYPGVIVDDEGNLGEFFSLENKDKRTVNCIWLEKFDRSLFSQGVLVHELQHYTIRELKRRGFHLNEGSEEAYTYFLESVYKQALSKLMKKKKGC